MLHFGKVIIVGHGLIGGSLALDIKRLKLADHIITYDLLNTDSVLISAVPETDLIIFATPVEAIPDLVRTCKPHLKKHTILMDVASTKSNLILQLTSILGSQIDQFVFTHPIAGKAKSGYSEAEVGLFNARPVIIIPLAETQPALLEQIRQFWQLIGAEVTLMTDTQHDAFYGRYSHLSNLLAYVLKAQLSDADQAYSHLLPPSFKAMTRLADSSPEMWRDICISNQTEILKAIHYFQSALTQLESLIQKGDPQALLNHLHNAHANISL
ncbi:MAG: prephenate dehydrogenase [Gammaproteobacteria bacterium]|jgi:prephenate dehydrogenase|nr:prephenate dehydrogenase [Gammaproteobacteria bacterium]